MPKQRCSDIQLRQQPLRDARAPEHFAAELERLHEQMDEIRSLTAFARHERSYGRRTVPELADVYAHLMAADVEPALSKDIIDRLEASMATDAFFASAGRNGEHGEPLEAAALPIAGRLEAFVRVELEIVSLGAASRRGSDVTTKRPGGASGRAAGRRKDH